jgi:hypothetical protein
VDVTVGGEIAGFAPAKKATSSAGNLEYAEHQLAAEATELLIRCRIAVSP